MCVGPQSKRVTLLMGTPVNREMLWLGRDSRGLTRAALAEATGLSLDCIARYERGSAVCPSDHLARIAEVLHYPIPFFYLQEHYYRVTGFRCQRLFESEEEVSR